MLRLLGRGGMGSVYLAEDSQLHRQVALKLPTLGGDGSARRVERFIREARSAAILQHPNICTIYDAGEIAGQPFISMAFVSGKPLDALIDPEKPMPQKQAAEFARKIALALSHAHDKGIVHRDLKPVNVMVTPDGEPVVMDFGLAKRVSDTNEAKLTHDGAVMGTPAYMAPEQVRGEIQRIGPATDVYALGVILFEMLTGQTPYTGPLGLVLGQILAAPVPPVSEFRADVNPWLNDVCQRAMAKDPADRYPSMTAFADALNAYLSPTTIDVELASVPTTATMNTPANVEPAPVIRKKKDTTPSSSNRVVLVASGAAAVLVLLAGVGLFAIRPKGEITPEPTANTTVPSLAKTTPASETEPVSPAKVAPTPTEKTTPSTSPVPVTPLPTVSPFASLFNGKDFTGWKHMDGFTPIKGWKIEDGVIARDLVNARTNTPGGNNLWSVKQYGDFVLELEFRGTGNSGIYLRNSDPWKPVTDAGLEVQIDLPGGVRPDPIYETGSFYGLLRANKVNTKPAVEWNTARITAKGANITVEINGEVVNTLDQNTRTESGAKNRTGFIGLQSHMGQVYFRNIKIQEQTTTTATSPTQTAPIPVQPEVVKPAAGFVSLFNGKDLTGWQIAKGNQNQWSVKSDEIVGESPQSWLLTNKDYENYVLRFEFRMRQVNNTNGGIMFHLLPTDTQFWPIKLMNDSNRSQWAINAGEKTGAIWLQDKTDKLMLIPPTQTAKFNDGTMWEKGELTVSGKNVTLKVNGEVVQSFDMKLLDYRSGFNPPLTRTRGRIGLQIDNGIMRFRNIEIQEQAATSAASPTGPSSELLSQLGANNPTVAPAQESKTVSGRWLPLIKSADEVKPEAKQWTTWDAANSSISFSNGALTLKGGITFRGNYKPTNYVLRAQVQQDYRRANRLNVGLAGTGTLLFWFWCLDNTKMGRFGVGKGINGKFIDLTDAKDVSLSTNGRCEMALAYHNRRVTTYVDGKLVHSFNDDLPPNTRVGAQATNSSGVFQKLEVFILDGTALTPRDALQMK